MNPMAEDKAKHKQPIIIKRIKKVHGGHHGGSWKIAYADFVTAMMAFFLLMWLLSLLNKYQLEGIAKYFKKPLKEVFTKQDDIAKKNTIKPDKLGPTTYNNTGSKEKTENSADKNLGTQDHAYPAIGQINQNARDKINNPQKNTSESQKNKLNPEQQLQQLKEMKSNLEANLKNDPEISQYQNQLNFIITSDGLKIVLKDLENKPMFSEGKTDFESYAENILSWLSNQINEYPNRIIIIGHTDSIPYANDLSYSNWELSADRANATRRVLEKSGMDSSKILRVIGSADTHLLDNDQGEDPSNRRIEIIVLTDQAAKHIEEQ
jgi:chemotaxis protein MotB